MIYYPEFAKRLDQRMECVKRPNIWLAEEIEVHHTTVGRWRRGENRPSSPEKVISVCESLGVYDNKEQQDWLVDAGYGFICESPVVEPPPPPDPIVHDVIDSEKLERILQKVLPFLNTLQGTIFADHSFQHIEFTRNYFRKLVGNYRTVGENSLTPLEAFISEAAIILHNIGLCPFSIFST